jgi:hypothetical protein
MPSRSFKASKQQQGLAWPIAELAPSCTSLRFFRVPDEAGVSVLALYPFAGSPSSSIVVNQKLGQIWKRKTNAARYATLNGLKADHGVRGSAVVPAFIEIVALRAKTATPIRVELFVS